MNWSPQQDAALVAVDTWLKDPGKAQVFKLHGYAGTGKTKMARHFAEGVSGTVHFACFTGKAAHVLRQKGCIDATTIHKLLYRPKERSKATLRRLEGEILSLPDDADPEILKRLRKAIDEEREKLSKPSFDLNEETIAQHAKLIVIDESSMVGSKIGQDLLSLGVPILALGDPGQLPPVKDSSFFNGKPDILLTEIHRQSDGSPIIELATKVRQGETLELGQYGDSSVISRSEMTAESVLETDQILVGTNRTRTTFNARIRELRDLTGSLPHVTDKVVCLANDHDRGLLNGSLWRIIDVGGHDCDSVILTVDSMDEDRAALTLDCHTHFFQGRESDLPYYERKEAGSFDYGYALTTHKAQGSQWDSVIVMDESRAFRNNAKAWLYTAITRAAEKVTVVSDGR